MGADAQSTSKPSLETIAQGELRALLPDQGTFVEESKLHEMPRQLRASVSSSVHRKNHSTFLLRLLGGRDKLLRARSWPTGRSRYR